MQYKNLEMKNNGYNGYTRWKIFVQKSLGGKKKTCKVGKRFTQELYMQENLPLFLQDLYKKTQHQVLLNQETTYT